MKITSQLSEEQVLTEIGARLARLRLDRNLTQSDLAEQAGLGLRTVQRLESGEVATQLSGFLRICRVLGLTARLEALLPERTASPMALLQQRGKTRQRASGTGMVEGSSGPWKWGDES